MSAKSKINKKNKQGSHSKYRHVETESSNTSSDSNNNSNDDSDSDNNNFQGSKYRHTVFEPVRSKSSQSSRAEFNRSSTDMSITSKNRDVERKDQIVPLSDRLANIETEIRTIGVAITALSNNMETMTKLIVDLSNRNFNESKEDIMSTLAAFTTIILSSGGKYNNIAGQDEITNQVKNIGENNILLSQMINTLNKIEGQISTSLHNIPISVNNSDLRPTDNKPASSNVNITTDKTSLTRISTSPIVPAIPTISNIQGKDKPTTKTPTRTITPNIPVVPNIPNIPNTETKTNISSVSATLNTPGKLTSSKPIISKAPLPTVSKPPPVPIPHKSDTNKPKTNVIPPMPIPNLKATNT